MSRRPLGGGRGTTAGRDERGAAAVEFALVVPILLLIVFGIINFGLVMSQKASLSNAVRIGARYGSVNAYSSGSRTCAGVIDTVRSQSSTLGISDTKSVAVRVMLQTGTGPQLVCSAAAGAGSSGSTAPCIDAGGSALNPDTLTVESTYASRLLVPTPGLGDSITLTQSSAFQCEYYK